MVTFALPGEYDGADAAGITPKSRPPLPFSKRIYAATPFAKRLGTPAASSRKLLITRDETLNGDTVSSRNNLFRASVVESPPTSTFSPSLPQSAMRKVFAPGVTPVPNRVYRESVARATPRGLAANSSDKELFSMRISSPPPELTGEVLANKVPKDWNSKGSIYADQFLADLCPPNLDNEQRRQFFCILDLRRLKYAANEIFTKKSWKLNIMNFAKEFEKSRSIILLRYGLYEFQSVKPSKEILKRWRREHGLPDPVEEEDEGEEAAGALDGTPSKPATAKKRKADDNLSKETADATENVASPAKRRATVRDEADEPTAATPAPVNNKRKAAAEEESPAKMQKTPASSAKSLFEKIANKPAVTPVPVKPVEKNAANGRLSRSVFTSLKPPATGVGNGSGNIFGYLSDASSAKNSGIEADAESESESDNEESQEAGQSDEPSGAGDASPQAGSNLFSTKPSTTFGTGVSSAAGTRESTPGRSLFERITKDQTGQPVRADQAAEDIVSKPPASSLNQTWNPTSSPLKFAPAASTPQNGSLFGKAPSAPSGSIFAPKSTAPLNIFGVSKQDQSSKANTPVSEADLAGGESDKENDSQPAKRLFSEPKVSALPSSTATPLFGLKPAAAEPIKMSEPAKPTAATANLFGAIGNSDEASKLFGDVKTSIPMAPTSVLFAPKKESEENKGNGLFGTSNANANHLTGASAALFGIKPAAAAAPSALAPSPAPTANLFGTASAAPPAVSTNLFGSATPAPAPANLFGTNSSCFASESAKPTPAPSTSTNLFGAAPTTSLFGAPGSVAAKKDPSPPASSQPASTPLFGFGASAHTGPRPTETSQAAAKSLFGAPKSPPAAASNLFAGSPMKQDAASPAKKPFGGLGTDTSAPPPLFSFGTAGASSGSSNLFGNAVNSAPAPAPASVFGAAPSNTPSGSADNGGGSFSFNFESGGASTPTGSFNNPFSSGSHGGNPAPGQASAPAPASVFSFGSSSQPGASANSGTGGSGMFQFGNGTGSQPSQASAPLFGSASALNTSPSSSFTATGSSSAGPSSQPSASMFSFVAGQPASGFNLAPPTGGSSTTGTNSPFNFGGGSSLATTPAGGTPEPSAQLKTNTSAADNDEDGVKNEQISLTEGAEKNEEVLHEVRAKVLKFVPSGEVSESEEKKSKSPWATKGVGSLRLLKHNEANTVRLLLRAEPRGNVAMNRSVLPDLSYKADEKYVKMTTSNEKGDGLETWMIQVKTKDMAKALAEALEAHKALNKK